MAVGRTGFVYEVNAATKYFAMCIIHFDFVAILANILELVDCFRFSMLIFVRMVELMQIESERGERRRGAGEKRFVRVNVTG